MNKKFYLKIALKLFGIVLLGYIIFVIVLNAIFGISGADDFSRTDHKNILDRNYYERDYAELYEHLCLYDLYDEEYDVYWEAANQYNSYVKYIQWENTDEKEYSNSEAMKKELWDELHKPPVFPENQKIFDELLAKLNKE